MNLPTFTCPECGRTIDIRDLKEFPRTHPSIARHDSVVIIVTSDGVSVGAICGECGHDARADVNEPDSWQVEVDQDEFLELFGVRKTSMPDTSNLSLNRDPETARWEHDE